MANQIEILLQLKDEMSGRLQTATGSLGAFASRMSGLVGAASIAGGALTAAAGSVAAFAVKISEQTEQLGNLSAASGVSANNLQVLQFAFKQGGVDAAALTQGLNFLNRAIASNDPALQKLGVTSGDTFEAFMQAARGISQMRDSAERSRATFEVFGRGGAQLIPILDQLATGFDGVKQAARESGNVMSDETLAKMAQLDAQVDKMGATFEGAGKRIAATVAGPLSALLDKLNGIYDVIVKLSSYSGFIRLFGETFLGAQASTVSASAIGTRDFDRLDQSERERQALEDARAHDFQPGPQTMGPIQQFPRFNPLGPAQAGFTDASADPMGLRQGPLKAAMDIGPMLDEAKTHLMTFQEYMLKFHGDLIRSFMEIGAALNNSIVNVFLNLTNKAQTFRSAMVSIFQSMVQGVLSAIGQIVAAAVTKAFLKILGIVLASMFGPAAGAAAGVAVDVASALTAGGPGGSIPSAGAPVMGMAPAPGPGNTYVIQTLSAKDVLQNLVSPTGEMRAANSRLREVAAAS